MQVDTLIHSDWIIPVVPENVVLEKHSLAIVEGKISAILPTYEAKETLEAKEEYFLEHHALLPSFINAHTHAAMTLMRGFADDLPLMTWLKEYIWPTETKFLSEDFVKVGTELAIVEMLKAGVSFFNDMYFYPNIVAEVAEKAKMRAGISLLFFDFPTAWAASMEEYLAKAEALYEQYKNHDFIYPILAPHAPYTVNRDNLRTIKTLSDKWHLPIHMHLHETAAEVIDSRFIQQLFEDEMLNEKLLAVHMTQLNADEIALLQVNKVHVLHCPESNLKLASGFCPVNTLLQKGINVALGTDGSASNNDLDMLGEMKTAALLAKAVSQDASAVSAAKALSMATINGAKAFGLEKYLGSLTVGKKADMIAIDLNMANTQPVYNPISQIVYAATKNQISEVWINGESVVSDYKILVLEEKEVIAKAQQWALQLRDFQK